MQRLVLRPLLFTVRSSIQPTFTCGPSYSYLHLMPKRKAESPEGVDFSPRLTQIRKMAVVPTETSTAISLTEKESQLKELLLDVAKAIDEENNKIRNRSSEPGAVGVDPVVLRWAGGWVRDKLLGTESVDIDTAINTMTGETFALKLCELCQNPAIIAKHAISQSDIGNLHKIARNPDKSKHLETTTIKLFGYDVDFVNLRRETYTEDSRNPQMEFGTAEEDALRRDATVNALFYNLNTSQVEDFTTGLEDMRKKLMRTPLDPFQTFTDDPLRVLRLVRFASRLQFSIDPDVEKVMGDERVLEALRVKISRERVGVEVEKMLKGKHPRESLEYIERLGLYHAIFTDSIPPITSTTPPPDATPPPAAAKPDIGRWSTAYNLFAKLAERKTPGSIYDVLVRHDEAVYYAWTLTALVPWEPLSTTASARPRTGPGKAPPPPVTLAAREGIKTPTKFCDLVTAAHNNRGEIISLKNDVVAGTQPRISERDTFGMAIRRWDARGGHWRLQVLYAMLVEAIEVLSRVGTPSSTAEPLSAQEGEEEEEFLAKWQRFLDHLHDLDVLEAPSLKRLIDGTQLAKALGVKPGRWMTAALDICVAWQLRHPEATDAQGAVDEVEGKRAELGVPDRK